jgi:uncharacterized membrane protein YccC
MPDTANQARAFLADQWAELSHIQPSPRPWQMPFTAGLTTALPLLIGWWLGHEAEGGAAALGTMVFAYLTPSDLTRRLITLMACAFGISFAFALGQLAAILAPALAPLTITLVAIVATVLCRYLRQGPPAGLFFVMACAIALFIPPDPAHFAQRTGILFLGAALGVVNGILYSLFILWHRPFTPNRPHPPLNRLTLGFEPLMIGLACGLSLWLALFLGLEKPFWAPISCLTVVQAVSLRKVWTRHMHRVIGTVLGLGLASAMLAHPLHGWHLALLIGGLTCLAELLIVRHFGTAVIFITPLAIALSEAQAKAGIAPDVLIRARLWDTVVGCCVALAFGVAMHHPALRRKVMPAAD